MPDADMMLTVSEIHVYASLLLKFFNDAVETRLQAYGVKLSGLQYGILGMLSHETLTVSALSQRMGIDPSSMVRIIDSLEGKGLAERGTDPNDRRRNPIRITDNGRALLAAVPQISESDRVFQALESLGLEKAGQLRDALRGVMQQFPDGRMVSALFSGLPGMQIDKGPQQG